MSWEIKSKDPSTVMAGKSSRDKQRFSKEQQRNPAPPNAVCATNPNFVSSIPAPMTNSVPRMPSSQYHLPSISTLSYSHPQTSQPCNQYETFPRSAVPYTATPYQICAPAPEYVSCLYSNNALEGLLPGY